MEGFAHEGKTVEGGTATVWSATEVLPAARSNSEEGKQKRAIITAKA